MYLFTRIVIIFFFSSSFTPRYSSSFIFISASLSLFLSFFSLNLSYSSSPYFLLPLFSFLLPPSPILFLYHVPFFLFAPLLLPLPHSLFLVLPLTYSAISLLQSSSLPPLSLSFNPSFSFSFFSFLGFPLPLLTPSYPFPFPLLLFCYYSYSLHSFSFHRFLTPFSVLLFLPPFLYPPPPNPYLSTLSISIHSPTPSFVSLLLLYPFSHSFPLASPSFPFSSLSFPLSFYLFPFYLLLSSSPYLFPSLLPLFPFPPLTSTFPVL